MKSKSYNSPTKSFNTPITVIAYKRVDTLSLLLNQIKVLKPKKLFIILDGPKNKSEKSKTDLVKKLVCSKKWATHVYINRSRVNLGLRKRVVTGLNWVFTKVDRSIIVEDDLLPDMTFYSFCQDMLDMYEDNLKVGSIAGYSYKTDKKGVNDSYYFSKYIESWGWATWKRSWSQYEDSMELWPELKRSNWLGKLILNKYSVKYWESSLDAAYYKRVDSWAYRWTLTCLRKNMLTIIPRYNLVRYLGWGKEATHTNVQVFSQKLESIDKPYKHPKKIELNTYADGVTEKSQGYLYLASSIKALLYQILMKLKNRI